MTGLRNLFLVPWIVASGSAYALTWHTGHFVVNLADVAGRPITNATVHVRTLNKRYLGVGGKESDYDITWQMTDTNGTADVSFRYWDADFQWWVETPSHYSDFFGMRRECFDSVIVPSDYERFSTNTVEGLRKYNELKALEDAGDIEGYYAKFEPKSVTYSSNVVYRTARFYPRRNPAPMYMYGLFRNVKLPATATCLTSNGVDILQYPVAEFDLKKGAILPPNANPDDVEDGIAGDVADFSVTRHCVETNGVRTFFGTIDFAPGCGAYRCRATGDESFPSVYCADTNAVYQNRIPYQYSHEITSGQCLPGRSVLDIDEYMVLRTRVLTNSLGVVTNCHYSKIVGSVNVDEGLGFQSTVFNPRPNDPNLEADTGVNLAEGEGAEARWP